MFQLHNRQSIESAIKHYALLRLCLQRDKEPLGVWMVSSPVSRDSGTQPDSHHGSLVASKHIVCNMPPPPPPSP